MATCEKLQDEEAPHHVVKDLVPHTAAALVAALVDVEEVMAPHDPGGEEVRERKDHDEG